MRPARLPNRRDVFLFIPHTNLRLVRLDGGPGLSKTRSPADVSSWCANGRNGLRCRVWSARLDEYETEFFGQALAGGRTGDRISIGNSRFCSPTWLVAKRIGIRPRSVVSRELIPGRPNSWVPFSSSRP